MASNGLKTLFYINFFKTFNKGTFFPLLRTSLSTGKVFRAFENIVKKKT